MNELLVSSCAMINVSRIYSPTQIDLTKGSQSPAKARGFIQVQIRRLPEPNAGKRRSKSRLHQVYSLNFKRDQV